MYVEGEDGQEQVGFGKVEGGDWVVRNGEGRGGVRVVKPLLGITIRYSMGKSRYLATDLC